jgi:hypothetical protein
MILKTTEKYPSARIELRTSEEILQAMLESPYSRRAPYRLPEFPLIASVREAEIRKLLAEHNAGEASRKKRAKSPRRQRCLSLGSTGCLPGLSPPSSRSRPPLAKEPRPSSLPHTPPTSVPQICLPPTPQACSSTRQDWMQSSPDASSCSLSETCASQHRSHQKESNCDFVHDVFKQSIIWPSPPPRPSGIPTTDELRLIEGEIELYMIREAYEKSVGRKLVSRYKMRLLKHECDTIIAKNGIEYRRRESERRRRAG